MQENLLLERYLRNWLKNMKKEEDGCCFLTQSN
jgi:hypothetical protein